LPRREQVGIRTCTHSQCRAACEASEEPTDDQAVERLRKSRAQREQHEDGGRYKVYDFSTVELAQRRCSHRSEPDAQSEESKTKERDCAGDVESSHDV
jgi:hypothetical protein